MNNWKRIQVYQNFFQSRKLTMSIKGVVYYTGPPSKVFFKDRISYYYIHETTKQSPYLSRYRSRLKVFIFIYLQNKDWNSFSSKLVVCWISNSVFYLFILMRCAEILVWIDVQLRWSLKYILNWRMELSSG